jgi:CRISPR-associated exonuclease Cas4
VYFDQALGLPPPETPKMEEGRRAHEEIERLEARRSLAVYGCEGRRRVVRPRLRSEGLGLSGVPDLLLEGEESVAVVEYKLTSGEPREGDWFQVAAYALLAEAELDRRVDRVILVRIPDGKVFGHAFSEAWRTRVQGLVDEILSCIWGQRDPGPAGEKSRCHDCPWQNFCADVW